MWHVLGPTAFYVRIFCTATVTNLTQVVLVVPQHVAHEVACNFIEQLRLLLYLPINIWHKKARATRYQYNLV